MLEKESGSTALASAALELYDMGFIPIPVNWRDKTPIVSWGNYAEERPRRSTIKNWFLGSQPKNMAIITGKPSGVCVLDIDEPDIFPFEMPVTPTVKTSRGYHLYFKYPEGVAIRNTDLPYGNFKADRSLATVPPSVHKSGKPYEWIHSLAVPFAELPDWLLELVRQRIKLEKGYPVQVEWNPEQETTAYGAKALTNEIETLLNTPEGARNNQYNKSLVKLGSLVAGGQLNQDEMLEAARHAGKEIGLEKEEMLATEKSALTKALSNPRGPTPKEPANDNTTPKGTFKLISFADVEPEPMNWIWNGVLAKGQITIIAGKPKTGKSQVSLAIASAVSRGDYFPCSKQRAPKGSAIIISSEDKREDTIAPRLMALGANMRNILAVDPIDENGHQRLFNLQTDIPIFDEMISERGDVQLLIIDVVDSYMGKGDSNSNSDVRALMAKLSLLAQKHNLSILLVRHKRKDDEGDPLNTMQGSVAWGGGARANWQITKVPGDPSERVMTNMGSNNVGGDDAFKFNIRSKKIETKNFPQGIDTSYVEWKDGTIKLSADQALADSAAGPKIMAAVEWLQDRLSSGVAVDQNKLRQEAEADGHSERTLRRAKDLLGIIPERKGLMSLWSLPKRVGQAA